MADIMENMVLEAAEKAVKQKGLLLTGSSKSNWERDEMEAKLMANRNIIENNLHFVKKMKIKEFIQEIFSFLDLSQNDRSWETIRKINEKMAELISGK